MKKIKNNLTSNNIFIRIITSFILMISIFILTTILSYYLLPSGFLLSKNNLTNFEVSNNIFVCTIQIFSYNMISILIIIFGSFFAKKKNGCYLSYGYIGLFLLIIMNGITLGTWSFTSNFVSVPLFERIIRTFDIMKNAGFLEMLGQLFICTSISNISLVRIAGKEVNLRKIKDIKLSKIEIIIFLLGFCLMFAGALIESRAIIA